MDNMETPDRGHGERTSNQWLLAHKPHHRLVLVGHISLVLLRTRRSNRLKVASRIDRLIANQTSAEILNEPGQKLSIFSSNLHSALSEPNLIDNNSREFTCQCHHEKTTREALSRKNKPRDLDFNN
eukprot:scaffold567_cov130-Cylindrotheca_fusiformis.AAC.2